MRVSVKILVLALVAFLTAEVLPGVSIEEIPVTMMVAIGLALCNAVLLQPLVAGLSIPFTQVTVGFFLVGINAFLIKLADHFVDGFEVNGWWIAILFALVITLFSLVLDNVLFRNKSFN